MGSKSAIAQLAVAALSACMDTANGVAKNAALSDHMLNANMVVESMSVETAMGRLFAPMVAGRPFARSAVAQTFAVMVAKNISAKSVAAYPFAVMACNAQNVRLAAFPRMRLPLQILIFRSVQPSMEIFLYI